MNLVSGNDEVKDETVPHRVDSLRSLYGVFLLIYWFWFASVISVIPVSVNSSI